MKRLYVLFDAQCELCVRCRNWLMKQPAFVPLAFVGLQSDEAKLRFPGIETLRPNDQLLAISDDGSVYRGAYAWIMCLWALRDYREWALRLRSPELLPTAKRVISMISQNRYQLEGLGSVMLKGAK